MLTILLAIAAAGVPMVRRTLDTQRLKAAGETVRAEWKDARVKAMEEGQIFCFRCRLGGNEIMIDRILDAHFTAGLSSRDSTRRFDTLGEMDPFEKGSFTGETEDFILRDPSRAAEEYGTRIITLPENIFVADLIALPEERAAFYLGLTSAGETEVEENTSESEEVANQELRLGESDGGDGSTWSAPIFFYPDGTTSIAAILLKSNNDRCLEVRLRDLTGLGTLTEITSAESYSGDLDPSRERSVSY